MVPWGELSFKLIVIHLKSCIWWTNELSNFQKFSSQETIPTNNYILFRTLIVCSSFVDWWADFIWKQSNQGNFRVFFVSISWLNFSLQRGNFSNQNQKYVIAEECTSMILCIVSFAVSSMLHPNSIRYHSSLKDPLRVWVG